MGLFVVIPSNQQYHGAVNTAAVAVTANEAIFIPFTVIVPNLIENVVVQIGVSSGNINCGIYRRNKVKLRETGSTAVAAGPAAQKIALATSIKLDIGAYYMAIAFDNAVATVGSWQKSGGTIFSLQVGIKVQAAAFALPNPAVFVDPVVARTTFPDMSLVAEL